MNLERLSRRELLEWLALGGVLLGQSALGAEKKSAAGPRYPDEKTLRKLQQQGWVVEYKRADLLREGVGLRAPSSVPPERYVCTPAIIESKFDAQGRWKVVMPSFAHTCNQTCLVTQVEVEADGKLLKRGKDYLLKPLVTRPLGNRFWQVSGMRKEKTPLKVRVIGIISNAAETKDLEAARAKIAQVAGEANQFEKKYKVPPSPHWLKKPSTAVEEAAAPALPSDTKDRFATLMHILTYLHKKCKLTQGTSRDPEEFVKEGMKGSCGANADFVNLAANRAGNPYLFYTEGYVIVPKLSYGGLHVWNLACCNGFFIADSLHPDLTFPEYSMYVATSVGPNIGHPAGANGSTSGGWATGQYVNGYYVFFSLPGYGIHKDRLSKMTIPEGVKQLGDLVAHQRARVNKRG